MNPRSLILLAMLVAAPVGAVPVTFTTADYFVDAIAAVDAEVATDSRGVSMPPDGAGTLPVFANAAVLAPAFGDDAFADAFADASADSVPGEHFLAVATEAGSESGNGAFSDAAAVASFLGTFGGAGAYTFMLDFSQLSETLVQGAADASGELFVALRSGFTTLLDRSFVVDELFRFDFALDGSDVGVLDIALVSLGSALGDGRAFNLASAAFTLDVANAVPAPAPLALAALPLLFVARQGSRVHRRRTERIGNDA
ncbi:MAG: hypothetical protein RLW62_13520 [Gammaproteobacteria bacterium]